MVSGGGGMKGRQYSGAQGVPEVRESLNNSEQLCTALRESFRAVEQGGERREWRALFKFANVAIRSGKPRPTGMEGKPRLGVAGFCQNPRCLQPGFVIQNFPAIQSGH